jgi:pimeloyl-ACP methyl ester carboxylesterase
MVHFSGECGAEHRLLRVEFRRQPSDLEIDPNTAIRDFVTVNAGTSADRVSMDLIESGVFTRGAHDRRIGDGILMGGAAELTCNSDVGEAKRCAGKAVRGISLRRGASGPERKKGMLGRVPSCFRPGPLRAWFCVMRSALLSVFVAFGLAACATPNQPDSFYQPGPLSAGARPGDLLRSDPMAGAPEGAKAWRILYVSTGLDGRHLAISGVAIVPEGIPPVGGRGVVAWGHSTTGVAVNCAPSMTDNVFSTILGLSPLLTDGYVVVASDYPGLGVAGPPSYLVGISEGRALLDSVRAVRRLPQAATGRRYALWGQSQGGHAALFAGQIAPSYAPELQLVGVAAAAPATELGATIKADIGSQAGNIIASYALLSWSRLYGTPLQAVVAEKTLPIMDRVAGDCAQTLGDQLLISVHEAEFDAGILAADPATAKPWHELLFRNSPGHAPIRAPLYIVQGDADKIVPPRVTTAFVDELCKRGETVQFETIAGAGHMTAGERSAATAAAWIRDRFERSPAPSDCAARS